MTVEQLFLVRGILAAMAFFFAFAWGRAAGRLHRTGQPQFRANTWVLRTAVTLIAVCWSGLDILAITTVATAAVLFALGWVMSSKAPKEEHLEKVMFPEE